MKKLLLLLLFLLPFIILKAQEKKFQIAVVGEFFSPTNSYYQATDIVNKVNGQTISGSASGFGIGKGLCINADYFFYKGLGVSLDIGFLEFENKLFFTVDNMSGGTYYEYKNTASFQTVKLGLTGNIRVSETNLQVQPSIGVATIFADFWDSSQEDESFSNFEAGSSIFVGPYIRLGASYKIIELLSIYADYEYTIIPAEFSYYLVESDAQILISNSDIGGHGIRFGLALHF